MANKSNTGNTGQSSSNFGTHPVHQDGGARAPKTVPTRPPKK